MHTSRRDGLRNPDPALTLQGLFVAHVPPDVYEQRLEICRTCHFFNPNRGMCNGCGCFIVIKARAPHVRCPRGLWGSVAVAES